MLQKITKFDNFLELLTKALEELLHENVEPSIQYLTIEEVAKQFKVSKPTVLSWLKSKKHPLPYFNFGKRQVRIKSDDLEEWIINHRSRVHERTDKLINIKAESNY